MKVRILMPGIICFLVVVCIRSHACAVALQSESPRVFARASVSGYRYAGTKQVEEEEGDKDWYLMPEEGAEEMEDDQFAPAIPESEDEDVFRYLPLDGETDTGRYQEQEEMDEEVEKEPVKKPEPKR
jgi:hypothetical protein